MPGHSHDAGAVARITSLDREALVSELRMPMWRKALRSIGNGDCVEVAPIAGDIVIRDSKNPNGPTIAYTAESWRALDRKSVV